MDKRITLVSDSLTRDNEGNFETDAVFAITWASILVLQGRELERAQQVVSEVTHKVTIPYQDGVTSGMRINYGARVFRIEAVQDPDERQVDLQLLSIETNDGRTI
jgi:SPP1 family predicted phage head-tail adaptor